MTPERDESRLLHDAASMGGILAELGGRQLPVLLGSLLLGLYPAAALAPGPATVADWDYPTDSLLAQRGGVVDVRLDINEAGIVDGCVVEKSSGHADLDTATCLQLTARAQFHPARGEDGSAVRSTWTQRVRWSIPKAGEAIPLSPAAPFPIIISEKLRREAAARGLDGATVMLDVDDRGKLVGCRLGDATASLKLTQAICKSIGRTGTFEPALDAEGRPVRATVTVTAQLMSDF